ncbi:ABC transporter permease [Alcaligenaceae bacterium CGII-47]|nr:ABC transporter permease [Alcaligenaceae bacterium CGII-47]
MTQAFDSEYFSWDTHSDPSVLNLRGDWTLDNYTVLGEQIARFHAEDVGPAALSADRVNGAGVTALDTAGASRLFELLGSDETLARSLSTLPAERVALLQAVAVAVAQNRTAPQRSGAKSSRFVALLGRIGLRIEEVWRQSRMLLGFMGLTLEALVRNLVRPGRWRITSVVAQIQETGLNAVPIVALLTFMVGAVVAFLGATVLADFGATVYTVNLVVFSFLREFAVLLTAILMAGRTASAFTAQLGSMKVNEEIDAIRMLGLNPVEVLVLPRILALLVSMPLLTFVGMIAGILGGVAVCAVALNISPTMFFAIFKEDIELRHFLLGMVKAPIFAYVIALIGCLEGFKVSGSAQSVGEHTTSAVVQTIFIVILLDALAALFFMEMGW